MIYTVVVLVVLGVLLAGVLFVVAKRFHVEEDPRIDTVEGLLPGANCGACGYPGCRGLATALVTDYSEELYCPVGGASTMGVVAEFLGRAAVVREPEVAVVRCGGSCAVRPVLSHFDGARSCAVAASTYAGQTGGSFGCLGMGDCVSVCDFDAIYMDASTGLPVVSDEKCTSCGKCVKACPKVIIELRRKGPKGRRVFVSCVSRDKGAVTRKACQAGCIGCGKCVKVCEFDAIAMADNLAYIDPVKCRLCRKCVGECPTGAIVETNFPPKKVVAEV